MQKLVFPDVSLEEIQRSGRVAKVVELINLRMVGGQFGPSAKATAKRKKGADPFGFQFSTRFNEAANTLEVSISIMAEGVHSAAEATVGEGGMDVGAGFILTYQLMTAPPPVELRESLFTAFSRINGLINAWPYFREFAHQAATRMGYPEVVVPLLRIEPNQAKATTEKKVATSVPKAVAKKPAKR